ncbi:hypothetical protein LAZ67_9000607 [Cordylochernes scorpioides]|uniref:Netrin receptor UNC5 n=1 Tax=Cordylochernes scorpioides TaxID=51811 RepID=A0ABY6KVX3_9ARAC|nr:hypothetical protein LAZ67_9000607 [Cordylochernes scorpioides]
MSSSPKSKKHKAKEKGSFSWNKLPTFFPPLPFSQKQRDEKTSDRRSTSDYSSGSSDSSYKCSNVSLDSMDSGNTSDLDEDYRLEHMKEIQRDTRHTRTLRHRGVTVVIPKYNLSRYSTHEFYLEFIHEPSFTPILYDNTTHASPIVSVGPHGVRFCKERPAFIFLPIRLKLHAKDKVICLCSNTPRDTKPTWEPISKDCFTFKNGTVIIKAYHFSLFTVIVEHPYFEKQCLITRRGGILTIPNFPGVKVKFPPGAIDGNVTAVLRVISNIEVMNGAERALASPFIMVGPHGCSFNPDSGPVLVKLPIPHYTEICQRFSSQARLTLWQSSTMEGEPFVWEQIHLDFSVEVDAESGLYTVEFPVRHFSFFKVMWDVLTASLYEAKLGVAYFYPYISFSMMCHAWMEENKDTQRFGLEVICYRSDKKFPSATNYKHKVGSSLKPKLVRPGCLLVRLKSELFEADTDAGEDPLLIKFEYDFRGREFEKQFACRFRKEKPNVQKGTFGKVIVERKMKEGENEPIFEFNLQKTGLESDTPFFEGSDRWSMVAIKELAGTLHINEESNWKKFANHIGFTKNEIETKLMYTADPFLAMVNLYQTRGGTPEEFVQALYEVSRTVNLKGGSPTPSTSSQGSPTLGNPGGSGENPSSRWKFWNFSTPTRWRDKDEASDTTSGELRDFIKSTLLTGCVWVPATEPSVSSRKRSNPSSSSKGSKRRRFSDVSETMSSSEESVATEDRVRDDRKLQDSDMWQISSLMNTMTWRALGRTLGLEESVLLNIEQAYKATGFRECAYQMLLEWKGRRPKKCTFGTLYAALCKENMNNVAKQLAVMKLGEE